jgi:carboxyl-terminal processing protease
MNIRKLPLYIFALGILGLTFAAGYSAYPLLHGAPLPGLSSLTEPPARQSMDVYWEAWRLLDRDFYGDKPDTTARTYGAIRGMVESFGDPYTYFVEPRARERERDELRGKFGGIGANLEQTEAGYVLHPVPGQPADSAGIRDGDILLMVDDQEITPQMNVDDLVALVRGPAGSRVTLLVRRADAAGIATELPITVTRAEIETPSMEWRLIDGSSPGSQVGYIVQTLFTERSPAEMQRAVEELTELGADSFILDLRGNPGGLVQAAVQIADMWLRQGAILIEQHADGSENVFEADAQHVREDAPLVIIVDNASASASEIVAGALRDHGRATLVGSRTFGKGSVQLIHELPDQSSLHVTNSLWLTPNRHQIAEQGLTPDILVAEGDDPLPEAIATVEQAVIAKALPDTAQP